MTRTLGLFAALTVIVSLVACGGQATGPAGKAAALPWESSLQSALDRAGNEGKPVMVTFYTDWCGWCKRLEEKTLSDSRVHAALARVVPVRLNAEKDGRADADRFGVRGYPTVVFLDAQGRELGRIGGYLDPQPFLEELDSIVPAARNV